MSKLAQYLAENPVWLAPMAGVTDPPFRAICREYGAGMSYTEMVSARGLEQAEIARSKGRVWPDKPHHINNSEQLLRLDPGETPSAVQLFGSEPDILARQSRRVAEMMGEELAFIDLNAGCPVPKVFNRLEGSGLMADPSLAHRIVSAMVDAVSDLGVEVTVKMRRGVDPASDNAVEFAQAVVDAGAAAVAVHGRFRSEYYRGRSNRESIARVKEAVSVPVIASGDVMTAQDAVDVLRDTGADGVLVARGAMGNPWIFQEALASRTARGYAPPTAHDRFDMMRRHAYGIVEYFGPKALVRMRRHAIWYCSGLPGASHFRGEVNDIKSIEDLEGLIGRYEMFLSERHPEVLGAPSESALNG